MNLQSLLRRENTDSSKHDYGHLLVAGGSSSMLGAVCLCALAAMRAGAGLTTVAIPKGLNLVLQKKLAHVVMTCPVQQTRAMTFSSAAFDQLMLKRARFNAVVLGPGIGLSAGTKIFIQRMIELYPLPMVVDADALNALSESLPILLKAPAPRILTPHAGEMARLLQLDKKVLLTRNRNTIAREFSRKYNCIVLLKGPGTIIAAPDGTCVINKTGNCGLATAGTGDVLSGMIGAFLAQGLDPFQATVLGAREHGKAGDKAARLRSRRSMTALDLIDQLR
jgi:NAD(P)H-hydrate epimerase